MAKQDRPDEHRARRKDREASVVGSLSDMGVADLVQTLEMGRKSGVLHLKARTGARGTCWLRDGRVVDCELTGAPAGEEAFYRILRWREGGFAIEFKPVEREERISLPTQALLLQGMRRIDDWGRVVEQLPPLDRRLEVDVARLGERLAKLPDEVNTLLRLFDGRRTLAQVLEAAPRGDVATAEDVARLVADGILREPTEGAEPARVPEVPTAVTPPPQPPEPGGVDWFAGPVGATVTAAPVASWVPAPSASPAASTQPEGAGWLEPPIAPSPVIPAPVERPRLLPRFSIPVPPPGSLPPPPSVAETLARYQVVPRPLRPAAAQPPAPAGISPAPAQPEPQPAPLAPAPSAAPQAVVPEPAAVPSSPVADPSPAAPEPLQAAPEVAPAVAHAPRTEPARAAPGASGPGSASGLARRLRGDAPAPRLDPASLPLHLEAPEAVTRERSPQVPRRSVAPYAALGLVVIAVVVGGTALTRRPVLRSTTPAHPNATAATPAAAVEVERAAAAGVAPAPAAPAEVPPPRGDRTLSAEPPRPPAGGDAPKRAAADLTTTPPASTPAAPARRAPGPTASAVATVAAEKPGTASRPPAAPAPSVEPDPRKLLASADRKYVAGRYADAIADYRRAIAQKPTPAAHVALARALYDAHRSAEAMQELDGVISENPRDASAWLLRGDIHQGEGRPADAREAYQRFLELQPRGEQARTVRMILGREQQ